MKSVQEIYFFVQEIYLFCPGNIMESVQEIYLFCPGNIMEFVQEIFWDLSRKYIYFV